MTQVIYIIKLNQQELDRYTISDQGDPSDCSSPNFNTSVKRKRSHISVDGYNLSYFVKILESSLAYRKNVINYCSRLAKNVQFVVCISLIPPCQHVMDYTWAKKIDSIVVAKRELDNAFSWMSTLGGAFSALGDYKQNFAIVAGNISVRQLQLALRLGDTPVVIRCCLYYALSLIQQGHLKQAKCVIKTQYSKAKALPIEDTKLINICKGIWSRLQYEWRLSKKRKELLNLK